MSIKTVLVTGASRGIGKAIAQAFIESGYQVLVGYNHNADLAEELVQDSDLAVAVHIDVSNDDSVARAVSFGEGAYGPIDVLINNAGIAKPSQFLTLTDDDWQEMLSVNLLGAVRCSRRVLPSMINRKSGRIINISSISGQCGGLYQVHYAAAKAGLINFTKSLARLYSHDGITSNAIAPGLIATDMIVEEMQNPAASKRILDIPCARLGTPQEVASIALFLASEQASYVTGQTINVNGGMYFG